MAEEPANPFANLGLDKALLRATQQPPARAQETPDARPAPTKPAKAKTDVSMHARSHAGTNARAPASTHAPAIEALHLQLQRKQHLASQTFRFRPEELAALDRVSGQLKGPAGRGLSKNDLVRLGLNWLLDDYEQNGEESVLAKVRARM